MNPLRFAPPPPPPRHWLGLALPSGLAGLPGALARDAISVALTIALVLAALAAGRALGRWLGRGRPRAAVPLALGLGLAGTLLLALGFDRLWSPRVFSVLVAAGFAARLAGWWRGGRRVPRAPAGAWVLLPLAAWAAAFAFVPETETDALLYHLAAPAAYLNRHGWFADRVSHAFRLPLQSEMLNAWALAAHAEPVARLLVLVFAGLAAAALLARVGRMAGSGSWLPVWLLLGSAPGLLLLGRTKSDLPALGFVAAAFAAGGAAGSPVGWLLLGFGVATKYTALLFAPVLLLRGWLAGARRAAAPRPVWAPALLLAPLLPWFAQNWLAFGNPVFFFFTSVFPTLGWSAPAMAAWREHLIEAFAAPGTRTPWGALAHLPVRLLLGMPGLAALAVLALARGTLRTRRLAGAALALEFLYVWLARSDRYGLPADWLLALAGGMAWFEVAPSLPRRAARLAALGLWASVLLPAARSWPLLRAADPLPCLAGAESPARYRARRLGPFDAVQRAVNGLPGARRLLLCGELRSYGFRPGVISALTFGLPPLPWQVAKETLTVTDFRKRFRELNLTHVADNFVTAQFYIDVLEPYAWSPRMLVLYRDFCKACLKIVRAPDTVDHLNGGYYVWEVLPAPQPKPPALVFFLPGAEGMLADVHRIEEAGKDPKAVQQGYLGLLLFLPDVGELHDRLGYLYASTGGTKLAYDHYRRTVAAGMVDDDNWLAFGRVAAALHKDTEAVPALQAALRLYPDRDRRALAFTTLATLAFQEGDALARARRWDRAAQAYAASVKNLEGLGDLSQNAEPAALALLRLAACLARLHRPDDAARTLARAVVLYPPAARTPEAVDIRARLAPKP